MNEKTGSRQNQILSLLLEKKEGLTTDEIAGALHISRHAVLQHLTNLESRGYIQNNAIKQTAGRPVRTFVLTDAGINRFPKQYAEIGQLIIANLIEKMGSHSFQDYMYELGLSHSQKMLPRPACAELEEKLEWLLKVMNDLGFQVRVTTDPVDGQQVIVACNCIFFDLSRKHQEICEFDRSLVTSLLNKNIDHVESMAKNGTNCRFKILNSSA